MEYVLNLLKNYLCSGLVSGFVLGPRRLLYYTVAQAAVLKKAYTIGRRLNANLKVPEYRRETTELQDICLPPMQAVSWPEIFTNHALIDPVFQFTPYGCPFSTSLPEHQKIHASSDSGKFRHFVLAGMKEPAIRIRPD